MSNEEHGTVTTSDEPSTATCPVMSAAHQAVGITANQHWWPDSLNLRILRQNHPQADPMGTTSTTRRRSTASTSTRWRATSTR